MSRFLLNVGLQVLWTAYAATVSSSSSADATVMGLPLRHGPDRKL